MVHYSNPVLSLFITISKKKVYVKGVLADENLWDAESTIVMSCGSSEAKTPKKVGARIMDSDSMSRKNTSQQ
jgi:hypothetical protein